MKKICLLLLFVSAFLSTNAQTSLDSTATDSLQTDSVASKAIQQTVQLAANVVPSKAAADSAYAKESYADAVALYEGILNTGKESADIYYNLGNSYYKMKNIAKAILNYERALLLNPGDSDIRFNLKLAQSKTVDNITPMSEVFLITWFKSLTNIVSEKGWSKIAIACFILSLILIAIYIFSKQILWKKIGFISAIVFILICILSNVFASVQKSELVGHNAAIVMSPSVTIKSTPNESGNELFILHEGTKVLIKDNTMKEWKEIKLEDGNVGWIPADAIEII
ncbi:tetratricopeptide repeat protein [Phocaeicola oris]|uniref:tetratricopeptide repeat protein n=1 Tax=Phocaeicola oris TaxID=2896850 RepID=UPI00234F28A6|nr:tetratricopeptide repeat protein [Phocaeicola oris]MCE2615417.1 tetratricopeptide repeat protein [Phocaeicola oris]